MAEKDSREHEGPSVCGFCHLREDVEAVCGKLWQTASCCAHHKCMQYSANLIQYKFDAFGGFKIHKVIQEQKRANKLSCSVCKKRKKSKSQAGSTRYPNKMRGASAGCSYGRCQKTFHYFCANKDTRIITKRIELKDDGDKKSVLYRVFCSREHYDKDRENLKKQKASNKAGETDSDEEGSDDSTSEHSDANSVNCNSQELASQVLLVEEPTPSRRLRKFEFESSDDDFVTNNISPKRKSPSSKKRKRNESSNGKGALKDKDEFLRKLGMSPAKSSRKSSPASEKQSGGRFSSSKASSSVSKKSPNLGQRDLAKKACINPKKGLNVRRSLSYHLEDSDNTLSSRVTSSGFSSESSCESAEIIDITPNKTHKKTSIKNDKNTTPRIQSVKGLENVDKVASVRLDRNSIFQSIRALEKKEDNNEVFFDCENLPLQQNDKSEHDKYETAESDSDHSCNSTSLIADKKPVNSRDKSFFSSDERLENACIIVDDSLPREEEHQDRSSSPDSEMTKCYSESESGREDTNDTGCFSCAIISNNDNISTEQCAKVSKYAVKRFRVKEDSVFFWNAKNSGILKESLVHFMFTIAVKIGKGEFDDVRELLKSTKSQEIVQFNMCSQIHSHLGEEHRKTIEKVYYEQARELLSQAANQHGTCVGHLYTEGDNEELCFLMIPFNHVTDAENSFREFPVLDSAPFKWTVDSEVRSDVSSSTAALREQELITLKNWLVEETGGAYRGVTLPQDHILYRQDTESVTLKLQQGMAVESDSEIDTNIFFLCPVNAELLNLKQYFHKCLEWVIEKQVTALSEVYLVVDVGASLCLQKYTDLVPKNIPGIDVSVLSAFDPLRKPVTCVILNLGVKPGDCEQTPGIENVTKPSTSGIKTSETPVLNIAFNKRKGVCVEDGQIPSTSLDGLPPKNKKKRLSNRYK